MFFKSQADKATLAMILEAAETKSPYYLLSKNH